MMLVGLAMRQCGPTADCILQALPEVSKTYQGVTGTIEFDQDCQRPNAPLVRMVYQDGSLEPLK
jgi:ABC-type branched-subunit amino acid transport system substrate-binding protein